MRELGVRASTPEVSNAAKARSASLGESLKVAQAQVAVARKGLKGLWSSSPVFANDLAALSWGNP